MRSSSEPLPHLDKPILRVKMHQYFDNITKEFDIALIKFDDSGILFEVTHLKIYLISAKARPQPHILPICLPPSDLADLAGGRAWVTGWGKQDVARKLMSNSLRKVEVPIISNFLCEKLFR